MSTTVNTSCADRIRAVYGAFAEGNVPAVLGSFHQDIVWNEAENFVYADGNPYKGPDAILNGVFMRLAAEWDNFRLENITVYNVEGNRALATGRYKGKNKATGKGLDAQFAHFWTLKDNMITGFQQYTDTWQAKAATTA